MNIKSIELKNFRCFENEKISFDPNLTVLIGNNGSGKSSVLQALTIAAGSFFLGFDNTISPSIAAGDVRNKTYLSGSIISREPQYPTEIFCTGCFDEHTAEQSWSRALNGDDRKTTFKNAMNVKAYAANIQEKVRQGDAGVILPIISYYGTGRLYATRRDSSLNEIEIDGAVSRTLGYKDCLSAMTNEKLMIKWFKKMTFSELQDGIEIPELSAVKKAISLCMASVIPDCRSDSVTVRYDVKSGELQLIYIDNNGNKNMQPMHELSDGYRNTLGMIADIAYRMAVLNPDLLDKCTETPGIVLIDEVDLHLHPQWQKKILGDLCTVFPNVQFIVTTHSPHVIASVSGKNIVRLENSKVKDIAENTYGKDANLILNTFMGVSERPESIEKQIAEIYALLDEENYADASTATDALAKMLEDENDPIITKFRTIINIEG